MEKYLITSWNTTTPSKREREKERKRERERLFKKTLDDTFSSRSSAKSEQWQRESTHGLKTCVMWFFDTTFMSKRRDTFSPYHKRERTKKTSLLFEKRRKAERWREEVYVYIYLEYI